MQTDHWPKDQQDKNSLHKTECINNEGKLTVIISLDINDIILTVYILAGI